MENKKREIGESQDNDGILGLILADRIEQARYQKSSHKVCNELGIDFIGGSNDY